MSKTDTLKQLLIKKSVRKGNFVLTSGKSSTFYVDARLTTMSPEGMIMIGELGLDRIKQQNWSPDSVGGLTLGADPVAFAISYASAGSSAPIRAFTVRKEAKKHGTGSLIEGPYEPGDKVVVVEDVITTGKSAIQAIDSIESMKGNILGVLAVVDREDGGREAIAARGYNVVSLVTISELLG
jgi:orotate phosphoribosyltransferase